MQSDKSAPLSLSFASKDAVALENKLLVAATVAAVLLAGSAIAYRRAAVNSDVMWGLFRKDSQRLEEKLGDEKNVEGTVDPDAMVVLPTASASTSTHTGQELEYDPAHTAGTTKSSRSKDRRRRGKDPLKDVLKNGKKLKTFPTPPGSSSTPSSPKPSAALLSPSSIGNGKQVGENMDLYLAFEAGSSLAALRTHIVDSSQALPESQRNPTKRRQRETSPSKFDTHTMYLSATGHSRDTSDVSQPSNFTHDGEDDLAGADFPGESNYRQYLHTHLQSQDSLTQSSLSHPRPSSSLADISEAELEGVWTTSVSKSRSRGRARLADVVFEGVRTETAGQGHDGEENRTEDGLAMSKGKTRTFTDQLPGDTEGCSKPVFVDVGKAGSLPQSSGAPIVFPSTDLPLHASCSDMNTNAEGVNHPSIATSKISQLPSALINRSSEKHKSRIREQECQQDTADGIQWNNVATPSQASSSGNHGTRDVNGNEVRNGEDKALDDRKQPKGNNGKSYASFSSVVTGVKGADGRAGVSQGASNKSTSGLGLTESDDISGLSGREEVETEFIFPTLNSQTSTSSIGSSPSARSTLVGASVTSQSPSKKSKTFTTNKSDTPPPNARTPATSNTRESHTSGTNAGGASTGMPALSAQTQLASLRGALEAARLREEKHKAEIEKLTKETEMLKWESANGRREVAELQTHVRQLAHQLQSYAALFASVAPHLNSQFTMQLPLSQLYPQTNAVRSNEIAHDLNHSDPGSSPNVDPDNELPNGDVDPLTSKTEVEPRAAEAQEDAAVTSSDRTQKDVSVTPSSPQPQPLQTPSSPASAISSPAQHPILPPPSAAIPPFFPYTVPPYSPTHHPHFPVHSPPWMYHHHYPSSQNSSGANSGPSSAPSPPQPYPSVYSPLMYPISPVASPVSPQVIGMHQFHHLHQTFGFGGGLRSSGTSSAGSHSPEITSSSSGLSKQKSRMRRRKSQMANLNGHARTGCEDVGDGWIGLGRMQPTASNIDKGRKIIDEGTMADGEGDDVDVEGASSPYSELLADAILKRSSTIRPLKKNDKKEHNPHDRREGAEEVEPFTEFTFPSLSDFGSVHYRTASRTESSISSSLSSSPPSTTATVPDFIGDQEDKASLPPVIENAEDSDPFAVQEIGLGGALSKIQDILVNEQATPKREVHEQSLTDSKLE